MRAKTIKQIKSEILELAAMIWPEYTTDMRAYAYGANAYNYIGAIDESMSVFKTLTESMPIRELHAYLRGLQRGLNNIR